MPRYHFHVQDGPAEDHVLNLPNDASAIAQALRTAADFIGDISLTQIGAERHSVIVTEGDDVEVVKVEIRAERSR